MSNNAKIRLTQRLLVQLQIEPLMALLDRRHNFEHILVYLGMPQSTKSDSVTEYLSIIIDC